MPLANGDPPNPKIPGDGGGVSLFSIRARLFGDLNGERRRKRFCPPDERWYDDQGPYVEWVKEGSEVKVPPEVDVSAIEFGKWVCFKNRTVVSQVLMASIDDYDLPAGHALEGSYTGINNKTTGILYKEEEVWEQDKSDTSFYQVRATHLPANRTVPT